MITNILDVNRLVLSRTLGKMKEILVNSMSNLGTCRAKYILCMYTRIVKNYQT